ncbi:IclR family transcriptional regulator [Rhodococcus sp. ARC_M6]|uniref:IclR family transcriptional regulator n=1 Tax=Rhodococcus sp. ARC_M6 TaxID=2928852 RepID=UPI001FB41E22|nr:IclR family transcriptional regulator [Rhodococcus sp. ARC_M6]MCJ0902797.1 IclR family transcriptional regulator [Rhodococcus sp. ARC_M6]
MSTEHESPIAVIDRVAVLLDAFADTERLTLSELSRRTGFPRSSTHRMLLQLINIQWFRRQDHTYELGMKMLELGSLAQQHDRVHKAAEPIIHELQCTTGMVVHLAVLDGSDILYLDKIGGRFGMAVPSRVGGRAPAHRTALGKALLAQTGADPITALPERPVAATPNTIADPAALRREFARIREQSVAHDHDESLLGVSCVAAAISDSTTTYGAISVCGPTRTMTSTAMIAPVRMAALATCRRLLGDPRKHRSLSA